MFYPGYCMKNRRFDIRIHRVIRHECRVPTLEKSIGVPERVLTFSGRCNILLLPMNMMRWVWYREGHGFS